MHKTITDANLIEIHQEISELSGNQVEVCKYSSGSRKPPAV